MDLKFLFIGTVLFINEITSNPVITYVNKDIEVTSDKDAEEVNESGRYQVTENVIDVPDDRTLASIFPSYGISTGLNYGNETVKKNRTVDREDNWNKEESNPNNEVNNIATKPNDGDKLNKDKGNNVKKNQFSILHIKAEYEDQKVVNTNDKCQHVFSCIKNYLYGVKKGFVDGIHSFLNGRKDTHSILDKFHRNVDYDDSDEIHSFSDEFGDDYID